MQRTFVVQSGKITWLSKERPLVRSFAELLKKYRADTGLTQQQLGDRLKLSPPYIAQIESGLKPPPQSGIVSRMAEVFRLDENRARELGEIAEYEREHQSLIKATRKLGYAVSGNHILVPERMIWRAVDRELSVLFKRTGEEAKQGMFVAGIGDGDWVQPGGNSPIIRSRVEMKAWLLDYLGDEPSIGLAFLGTLYAKIRLTEESLMLDEPTGLRERILSQIDDPGVAMGLLKSAIDQAKELIQRREHPNVLQGDDPGAPVVKQPSAGPGLSTVPVVAVLEEGEDQLYAMETGELVELPSSWLVEEGEYQAIAINGGALTGLGLWPGSRAIMQFGAVPKNEDLVLIRIAGELHIKRYFALGMDLFLQGGGPSNPTLQIRRDEGAEVMGVIRQLISRFGDLRRARTEPSKETRS